MRLLVTGGSGFIGTNLVALAREKGYNVCNADRHPPQNENHEQHWFACDVCHIERLRTVFDSFSPTHVVHLAATTGVRGTINEYRDNWVGTERILKLVREVSDVQRVVVASSALVCKIGYVPESPTDYRPNTAYGQSKVNAEQCVRNFGDIGAAWSIVRPVSIWGPWFAEPYRNMFRAIRDGWYCHISWEDVKKSLGYVGNTVRQIHEILKSNRREVEGKTFYLADDPPVSLRYFAESVRSQLCAPPIYTIPRFAAAIVARIGDCLQAAGWRRVPLTSFRLNNILTEYVYDVSPITSVAGDTEITIDDGVRETRNWLAAHAEGW